VKRETWNVNSAWCITFYAPRVLPRWRLSVFAKLSLAPRFNGVIRASGKETVSTVSRLEAESTSIRFLLATETGKTVGIAAALRTTPLKRGANEIGSSPRK
jgi:hypothetical protein